MRSSLLPWHKHLFFSGWSFSRVRVRVDEWMGWWMGGWMNDYVIQVIDKWIQHSRISHGSGASEGRVNAVMFSLKNRQPCFLFPVLVLADLLGWTKAVECCWSLLGSSCSTSKRLEAQSNTREGKHGFHGFLVSSPFEAPCGRPWLRLAHCQTVNTLVFGQTMAALCCHDDVRQHFAVLHLSTNRWTIQVNRGGSSSGPPGMNRYIFWPSLESFPHCNISIKINEDETVCAWHERLVCWFYEMFVKCDIWRWRMSQLKLNKKVRGWRPIGVVDFLVLFSLFINAENMWGWSQ